MTPNNNSIATINQQLNNLGTINQQLSTLTQQLSGLNQQHQNLQHFQNFNNANAFAAIQPMSMNPVPINNNNNNSINNNNNNNINETNSSNNNNINSHNCIGSIKNPENLIQTDLFQSNQELLNRLQNLTLGFSNNNSINHNNSSSSNYSPHNSFMYGNPSQMLANQNSINNNNNNLNTLNNNNINLLSSPSSVGNLTPSPIFNRSSYSSSPMLDNNNTSSLCLNVSVEKNLDRKSPCRGEPSPNGQFIRPISTTPHGMSTTSMIDTDGKLKITLPMSATASESRLNSMPSSTSSTSIASSSGTIRKNDKRVTLPDFTLKITDECGNITNARKLSATPSFITRSTSEKVPNRSQLMSEVQRTAWARHTTK